MYVLLSIPNLITLKFWIICVDRAHDQLCCRYLHLNSEHKELIW